MSENEGNGSTHNVAGYVRTPPRPGTKSEVRFAIQQLNVQTPTISVIGICPNEVPLAVKDHSDGAAIITGVVPLDVIERFNSELAPRVASWENPAFNNRKFSPHTKFVNGLLAASAAYRHDILNNDVLHKTCKAIFERAGDYWLVGSVLRLTEPGHPAQPWHRDANGWQLIKSQRPEAPVLTATLIIPTTDFTAANGATRVYLGSHHWPGVDAPSDAQPALATMKPGDMLIMRQGIVHGGGEHTQQAPDTRSMMIMSVASCQISQFESALGLPRELVESLTPVAQKMVGWRTLFPVGNPMGLNTFRSGLLEDTLGLQSNQPLKG